MRASLLSIVPALAVAATLTAQGPSRPLFSADSADLVVLPVVVTHGDGNFVSGLTKDQFAVFDNGRRQEISLFSNADTPVTLGLVIDDSSSMGRKLGEVIAATLALVRSSNPQDQVFAIDFNDNVRDVASGRTLYANDVQGLNAALPSALTRICMKAMAKRPADRYPSAGALAADLRRFLAGRAPRSSRGRRERRGCAARSALLSSALRPVGRRYCRRS